MQQEFIIYAVAALVIGVMFLFSLDVIKKSNETVLSIKNESASVLVEKKLPSAIEKKLPQVMGENESLPEKPLVYPFYVDCSNDLIKSHLSSNSAEADDLIARQGA